MSPQRVHFTLVHGTLGDGGQYVLQDRLAKSYFQGVNAEMALMFRNSTIVPSGFGLPDQRASSVRSGEFGR